MGTLGWLLLFALIGAFLYWLGDRAIRRDAARADDDDDDEPADDDDVDSAGDDDNDEPVDVDDDDEEFDPVMLATAVALALGGVGAGAEAGDINLTGLDASEPVGMSMMLDMGEL
jgi:hypothetical protein